MVGELNKLLIIDVYTRMHPSTDVYSDVVTDAFNTKINVRNASIQIIFVTKVPTLYFIPCNIPYVHDTTNS